MESSAKGKKVADGGMKIPCKSSEFIRAWLEIIRSVHKLTPKEMDVAAKLIEKRFELARDIKDQALIDKALFDKSTKGEIARASGVSMQHFKMVLHRLRERGIVVGNTVDMKYLPDWQPGKRFRWLFVFENEE